MANPDQARSSDGKFARVRNRSAEEQDFDFRTERAKLMDRIQRAEIELKKHELDKELVNTDLEGVQWDRKRLRLRQAVTKLRAELKRLRDEH